MRTLRLYNSDGRTVQEFSPLEDGTAGLYCCGPTVYNYAHIGNLRAYTCWDILRRTLNRFGYKVRHVMNITDVGHLSDDSDQGEDKMLKGARERNKTVWEIAEFFTEAFFNDIDRLNILKPDVCCRATEHIGDMIKLIERLEERGLTYSAGGNVYFRSEKFPSYGKMALLDKQNLRHGARVEADPNKKHPLDFVLWFTKSKFENQAMVWDSPWGRGYPGWHLECSAMSSRYLGERIDIHTGGVDHIPVHHTNEIAQSEGAFGHRWVNYWLHNEFLIMKDGKMSKSKGGFLTLEKLTEDGYDPLDYRYFLLGGHYRSQLVFSREAMDAARSARKSLSGRADALRREAAKNSSERPDSRHLEQFDNALANDLNTPQALAGVWGLVKDENLTPGQRLSALLEMDSVLGLGLGQSAERTVPDNVQNLLKRRTEVRAARDWAAADAIRDELTQMGWKIVDTPDGPRAEQL